MSGGCCLRQYMYAPVHGPAAAKDKERCCVRLRRFCVKEITSLAALCVLALLAAALARNGMRWWASGAPCAARNCNECARASHCVWCEGPTLGGSRSELPMPGYCEEADQTGASTCTAGLDAAACAAEGAKEDPWAVCRAEKRLRKNSQDMTQRNTDRQHGHDRGEIRDNDGNSHADRGLKLWVRLHGHDSKKTEWTADWTSAASFAAGDTASQTIECEEDIGTVTQVDLCLMRTEQGVECVAQQQPRYQQAADAEQQAPHGRSATWCEHCGYKLGITSLCLLLIAVLAILGSALRMLLHADLTANGWQHGMFGVGRDGSGRPVHLPQPLAFSCRTVVLLALLTTSAVVLGCIQLAGSTQLFWGSARSHHSSCEQLILVALLCGFVGVAGWLGMAEAQLGNRVASLAWTQANQTTDLFDPAAVNDILDDVVTTLASQC